ncbi:MAG: helix-hairpin-helix domain-containing protein [Bacillota bacterium]
MKLNQEKFWIILILVAVTAYWVGGKDLNFSDQEMIEIELSQNEKNIMSSATDNSESKEIVVHIGGEVKNPGVFSFSQGVRLIDAISVAGGETTKAALDQINLARILHDGEHIIIPSYLSSEGSLNVSNNKLNNSTGKVNLNLAGSEELSSLTGIGAVRAAAIIEYRDKNGNFKDIEEIKNVSGIGIHTYNNIKDNIKI